MTTACDLPACVEPGVLPRRVRFYALRREVLHSAPARAFFIGLSCGIVATVAALGLIACAASVSGCTAIKEARQGHWEPKTIKPKAGASINAALAEMDAATRGIVFYPTK